MYKDKWFTAKRRWRKAQNCNLKPSDRVRLTTGRSNEKPNGRVPLNAEK